MYRWILAVVFVLGLCTSAALAQPFVVTFNYYDLGGGDAPLVTECDGAVPIPDGRVIKIFQDIDSDGPDPEDTQPTVCDDPPGCLSGPAGTVSLNEFLMNGSGLGFGAGYFLNLESFRSINFLPPGSDQWYLRVYEPDGETVLWTSSTFTLGSGPQDIYFTEGDWTCGQGGNQCVVIDEVE